MTTKVQLRDGQKKSFNQQLQILENYVSVINTGDLGSGKTPQTALLAQTLGLNLFVVCMKSNVEDWLSYTKMFRECHVINYHSFRSKNNVFNHSWLETDDNDEIILTHRFMDLIDQGTLIVFDESQAAKNANANQTKACCAVSKYVREQFDLGGSSRIALLSRTPTSGQASQIVSMMRVAGIVTSDKLLEKVKKRRQNAYQKLGFNELINYCSAIDPKETKRITKNIILNEKTVISCCYDLYEFVLKKSVVTTMENTTRNIDIYNMFFTLPQSDLVQLEDEKVAYKKVKEELERGETVGKVMKKYNILEKASKVESFKEDIFVDATLDLLESDPTVRVIIYLWTKRTLNRVAQALKSFDPVVVNGPVPGKVRKERLNAFTDPNSTNRILLTHPKVLATGTNIVDETETITFFSLMNASIFYNDQHQASGRTTRGSGKKSYFVVVYIDGLEEEKDILQAQARKSNNLRRLVKTEKKIKFLTDYPIIYESERNIANLLESP